MEPPLLLSTPTRMMPLSTVVSSRGACSCDFKNLVTVLPSDTDTRPARSRVKYTAEDILPELSIEYTSLSITAAIHCLLFTEAAYTAL